LRPELSSNGNGFSEADLVSLDNLDLDHSVNPEDIEVFEENDEIDLSSLTRMSEDAPVVRLVNCVIGRCIAPRRV
jgi:hypothetical protein